MDPEFFDFRQRCRRVSAKHIAHVTPEDVDNVSKQFSPEQLREAMHVMAQQYKYGEVVGTADPRALRRALAVAAESHEKHRLARSVVQHNRNLQCSILENIDEDLHRQCVEALDAQLQAEANRKS